VRRGLSETGQVEDNALTWTRGPIVAISLTAAVVGAGCTHTQLRHNTVKQAETLTDTYTQQVLDNLAMFVYAPDSMPQFSFPKEGTTGVTDDAAASTSIDWIASGFNSACLSFVGNRNMKEAWTMIPIKDPHKLVLMRCAYKYAVASLGYAEPWGDCPNCDRLLEAFHAHDASEGGIDDKCVKNLSEYPWFGVGRKRDVPRGCGCIYVGHYCDVYVWVLPEHRDKLTQLTLAILDYAVSDPPEPETKAVMVRVERDDEDKIKGTTREERFEEEVKRDGQIIYRRPRRTLDPARPSLRALQQRLRLAD
jgi:hypothetical protein